MSKITCSYCQTDHTYVCDCGHKHDRHTLSGGCQYYGCSCEGYSQRHQRRPEETEIVFQDRICGRVKPKKGVHA